MLEEEKEEELYQSLQVIEENIFSALRLSEEILTEVYAITIKLGIVLDHALNDDKKTLINVLETTKYNLEFIDNNLKPKRKRTENAKTSTIGTENT